MRESDSYANPYTHADTLTHTESDAYALTLAYSAATDCGISVVSGFSDAR